MEPDGSFKVGDTTYIIDASEESMHDSDSKPKLVCKQLKILVKETTSTFTSNSKISAKMQVKKKLKEIQEKTEAPKIKTKPSLQYVEFIAAKMELEKHRYNIRTILQYSNATPIRLHYLGSGYVCCFCNESFLKAADLKNHTIVEHDKIKNKFKPRGGLTNFLVKLDITSLCCNICNFAPDNLDQLIEHLNNVHAKKINTNIKNHIVSFKLDEEEFKCHNCSTDFNSFRHLLSHLNKYFANFLCDVCGSGFVNRYQLLIHSDSHERGSYKCSFCEKMFLSEMRRKTHEHRTHKAASAKYRCYHCGDPFKNQTDKQKHMVEVHGAKYADLKCNACDKTFKSSKSLQTHKNKEHLMRRWSCKLCDKEFFRADRLKRHEVIHSGVRNFTCDLCSKSFGRRSSLNEHMRTHLNDRQRK